MSTRVWYISDIQLVIASGYNCYDSPWLHFMTYQRGTVAGQSAAQNYLSLTNKETRCIKEIIYLFKYVGKWALFKLCFHICFGELRIPNNEVTASWSSCLLLVLQQQLYQLKFYKGFVTKARYLHLISTYLLCISKGWCDGSETSPFSQKVSWWLNWSSNMQFNDQTSKNDFPLNRNSPHNFKTSIQT